MKLQTIYDVTELSKKGSNQPIEETVSGVGQASISTLRKQYHKFTKFVLRGWNINGRFVPLKLRHR